MQKICCRDRYNITDRITAADVERQRTHALSTRFFKVARYLFSECARFIQKDSLFNLRTANKDESQLRTQSSGLRYT